MTGRFLFRPPTDGVYGFRTHRELGDRVWDAPQAGLAPQREVIIDTAPPVVHWTAPLGDLAADGASRSPARVSGAATLSWAAQETNPAEQPVRLEYRLFAEETWRPLAGPMADRGSFDWVIGDLAAPSAEVRLSYSDLAGHVTTSTLRVLIAGGAPAVDDAEATRVEVSEEARNEARRAYAMATVARLQENWEAAEKQLLRATTADATYARAWVDLGGIYVHDGRWQAAADVYRKALDLAPESENAAFGLARAQANQRDLKGAADTLDQLVQQRPENADAWRLYGDVLYAGGDLAKARQCWLKALSLGGGPEGNLAALRQRLELKR
jgi:tetratricopeptide (TPR) repeat protein